MRGELLEQRKAEERVFSPRFFISYRESTVNADRNKIQSQREILSSSPSGRNEGAGFDRASKKSGSSELDRTAGNYFLPSFDGS